MAHSNKSCGQHSAKAMALLGPASSFSVTWVHHAPAKPEMKNELVEYNAWITIPTWDILRFI